MQKPLRLAIEGMHCQGCVNRVRGALSRLDGVEVGNVEVGSAEVRFDDSRTAPAELVEAINRIGFTAREA
jgi:copper chaperone CopZ